MGNDSLKKELMFEHRFWLQILGDHSRFIFYSLSPVEKDEIERAVYFIREFDQLLTRARQSLNSVQLDELTKDANSEAHQLREFKLHLLKRHLTGKIAVNMSPSFFNHMINELEEYLCVLNTISKQQVPDENPVHHHLLWLSDAVFHAGSIESSLDDVEREEKDTSRDFARHFEILYLKAIEMAGYMRTDVLDFPSLERFNEQVNERMKRFMDFLEKVKEMDLRKEILGEFQPLIPDHMFREECYYLTRLSRSSNIECPDCDPTAPRVQE